MKDQDVQIVIRTSDRTRMAEVTLPRAMTVSDILQACKENWKLPTDVEYQIMNATSRKQLLPEAHLTPDIVGNGDELIVNPMLVAG